MAEKPGIRIDPTIARIEFIKRARYQYFRWNARTSRITAIYLLVIPSIIGFISYNTDGKWDLRGKRRGDDIKEF